MGIVIRNSSVSVINSSVSVGNKSISGQPPASVPNSPTINSITYDYGTDTTQIDFTLGGSNGTTITDIEWYSDVTLIWQSLGTISGTGYIYALEFGQTYNIQIRAVTDVMGIYSSPSNTVSITPSIPVPSAPTINSITPDDGGLTINFTLGNANGSNVIYVEWYSTDTGIWQSLFTTTSPASITGLTNDNEYDVSIRSVTDLTMYSDPSNVVNATPSAVPPAPPSAPILSSIVASSGELQFNFNNFTFVDPYPATDVQYSLNGGSTFTSMGTVSSPFTVTGLTNGIVVGNIQIRSTNAYGTSSISNQTRYSCAADPLDPPYSPIISVINADTKDGNGRVEVFFDRICFGGDTSVSEYSAIEYSIDGGLSFTPWGVSNNYLGNVMNSGSFYIDNLSIGTEYSVILRGVNANGNGQNSNEVFITPTTVPGFVTPPTINSVTPYNILTGGGELEIDFSSPDDGGSPITDIEYFITGSNVYIDPESLLWQSAATTSSPFIISGLTNGETYWVSIRGVNANGYGLNYSTFNAPGIPYTLPDAPTIDSIIPGNESLYVYFTPPMSDGGDAIYDYEWSLDGGSTFISTFGGTTSPGYINFGVMNDVTYDVVIRAINNAGSGPNSNTVQGTPTA